MRPLPPPPPPPTCLPWAPNADVHVLTRLVCLVMMQILLWPVKVWHVNSTYCCNWNDLRR